METIAENTLEDIISTIDNEDNIYYINIKIETEIPNFLETLIENPVESLYIIEVERENLFDKLFLLLKNENMCTKHKIIFIDNNLPIMPKMVFNISNYEDLKECKIHCPFINNTSFISGSKKGHFIITLK